MEAFSFSQKKHIICLLCKWAGKTKEIRMESTALAAELRVKLPVVCTITPPSPFLEDERVFCSLGILRVAAVLRERGYSVEHLDLSGLSNPQDAVRDHIGSSEAEFFGLTATTPQLPYTVQIAQEIRRLKPSAKVILGGPHITLVNAALKKERKRGVSGRAQVAMNDLVRDFDILVAGDGEKAIFEALKPGVSFVDADEIRSPLFLESVELNTLPMPARDLIDLSTYHYSIDGVPATSLIAQLGCPFECGFCGGRSSAMLRKIRTRTSDSIIEELRHIYTVYGIRAFMFYDDELNVNKGIVDLMRRIRALQDELGVEFRLRGFIKSELFTEEQAAAMYAAGFRWILVGFESGSPRILTNIKKKADRRDNSRCVEIARAHGLKVKALMSVGHPGESPETIRETEEWLLEAKPDDFDVSIITCYPGTPYYDEAEWDTEKKIWFYTYRDERTGTSDRLYQKAVDFSGEAAFYKGKVDGGYNAFVYTDYLTSDDLVAGRDRIERSVRAKLGIPFNPSAAARSYEHSMGMHGSLPASILRRAVAKERDSAGPPSNISATA